MFREAGLDVVAIAGHSSDKTKAAAAELGVEAVGAWRDLIARDLDLVTIVTPPSEHLEMALAVLAAGKHVMCEKPTALDADQAEQLVGAARSQPNRIALIDHELRFLPSWREAQRRVPELGGIRYAEVRYASPGRGDRARAWNWWSDAVRGGGIWGAVGSHFIDAVRYLLGEIDSAHASLETVIRERPVPADIHANSVGARSSAPATLDGRAGALLCAPTAGEGGATRSGVPGEGRQDLRTVTSDDLALVNLRLTSGALVTMTFSVVASGPDEPTTMTIHCEEGALRLTGEELLFAKRGSAFERVAGNDLAKHPGNSAGGAFASGTHYLGIALKAALDDGRREALSPAATFEDGLAQQRVLDAARRSSSNGGRWESVG
jgi:predicted dehydrogenase